MSDKSNQSKNAQGKENQKNVKLADADTNPCLKEASISRLCLEKNLHVREECKYEYENYNRCKKFWGYVRLKRKLEGIKPPLPRKQEREKILELRAKGIHVTSVQ